MERFLQTHRLDTSAQKKGSSYENPNIPDDLKKLIKEDQGNTYANGFFRFVDPDAFKNYFAIWNIDPNTVVPFIKSAFGHLVFYHQNEYKLLNPIHNVIDILGGKDELQFILDVLLSDRPALENSLLIDVYEQAVPRFGPPQVNEIYAFIPAIGLGGARDASNIHKVKMNEQMRILSQL